MEREIRYSSPPYADPLVILNANNINHPINPTLVPRRTRLHYICENFIKFSRLLIHSLPVLVFLLFLIYQITLACYNCGLENSNLGWIRASFFLNIPFVLCVFIYFGVRLKQKKLPSVIHVLAIIVYYMLCSFSYTLILGIYFEIDELKQIRSALDNATAVELLPCPVNHYKHVYGMKIASLCSPGLICFVMPFLGCLINQERSENNDEMKRCDRIISRWTNFVDTILQRHTEETVVEHF